MDKPTSSARRSARPLTVADDSLFGVLPDGADACAIWGAPHPRHAQLRHGYSPFSHEDAGHAGSRSRRPASVRVSLAPRRAARQSGALWRHQPTMQGHPPTPLTQTTQQAGGLPYQRLEGGLSTLSDQCPRLVVGALSRYRRSASGGCALAQSPCQRGGCGAFSRARRHRQPPPLPSVHRAIEACHACGGE